MAKQKSEVEVEAEKRLSAQGHLALAITNTINTFFRYGALCFMTWCGYLSISALAGHHTFADIGIRLLGNVSVNNGIAYLFGGGGIAYGVAQHRLKGSTVKALQGRIHHLETSIDPQRSSSQLTTQGETNPEDIL